MKKTRPKYPILSRSEYSCNGLNCILTTVEYRGHPKTWCSSHTKGEKRLKRRAVKICSGCKILNNTVSPGPK
jgi:hypothetical protein